MEQLSAQDASFLYAETPTTPSVGAWLNIYDPSTAQFQADLWDVYRKTGTDCVGALTRWAIEFGLDEMPELPSQKAQLQFDL